MDENMNTPTYQAAPQPPAEDNSTKLLIFGILSIALSGVIGLVFAILAKKEATKYEQNFGPATGKAKVGKILGTVGLIVSIIATVLWVLFFCCVGCAAALAVADSPSYYY